MMNEFNANRWIKKFLYGILCILNEQVKFML